jgi:hypothetical protein
MPNSESVSPDDVLDRPIWGAKAIAAEANVTAKQAFHMLEAGHLPGTKVGRRWVTTRRRLRERLG